MENFIFLCSEVYTISLPCSKYFNRECRCALRNICDRNFSKWVRQEPQLLFAIVKGRKQLVIARKKHRTISRPHIVSILAWVPHVPSFLEPSIYNESGTNFYFAFNSWTSQGFTTLNRSSFLGITFFETIWTNIIFLNVHTIFFLETGRCSKLYLNLGLTISPFQSDKGVTYQGRGSKCFFVFLYGHMMPGICTVYVGHSVFPPDMLFTLFWHLPLCIYPMLRFSLIYSFFIS